MVHKTADTLLVTIKLALRLPHFHRNFSFDRFFFLSRHVYETQTLSVCLCVCGKSNILPHSFTAAFHPPTPNTFSQCYRTLARTNFVPFVFVFFFNFWSSSPIPEYQSSAANMYFCAIVIDASAGIGWHRRASVALWTAAAVAAATRHSNSEKKNAGANRAPP